MIFDMVIYVTLINLTEMDSILLLLKSCLFFWRMCFRICFFFFWTNQNDISRR